MFGLDEVVEDVVAIDGKEGVAQQLVALSFFALELIDDFEVDVLVVELGDQAADQDQSLLSAEPIVLGVLDGAHQHCIESLVVPIFQPPHHILQGLNLSQVLLLFAELQVAEHQQSDGYLQMLPLGTFVQRVFQLIEESEDIVDVILARQVDWL